MIYNPHPVGDTIEKNEMDRVCSACGGKKRRIQGFDGET